MSGFRENEDAEALAYLRGELNGKAKADYERRLAESETMRAALERNRELLERLTGADEAAVVRLVNATIATAIGLGASDLHVLPERRHVAVRVRVDGALRGLESLPKDQQAAIVDRLKLMADMNLTERRLPQDGRIPVKHDGKDYDLRVTVLPTLYGEHVSVRILSREAVDARLGLDNLGLGAAQVAALKRLARRPAGLIVVTGPADAGKTTVLYSLLREMQAPDLPRRTLFTVEDPVEFQLPGVAQTAVSPRAGLTYEAALHTLLRSDADAVLCAQMRSLRTAELLTELAHTGRLVLTALHVPSAPAVADWMVAVGIERFLSAQVLAGAVSLRLVGGVCLHCREEYRPAADEIRRAGLSPVEDGPFLRGKGCAACGGTGVKGRVPLCEVLEMDAGRRRLLAEGGSGEALWEAAFGPEGGSPALRDDARAQVRAGRITVEAANWALTDYPHPAACGVPTAEMAGGYYPLPSFGEE